MVIPVPSASSIDQTACCLYTGFQIVRVEQSADSRRVIENFASRGFPPLGSAIHCGVELQGFCPTALNIQVCS